MKVRHDSGRDVVGDLRHVRFAGIANYLAFLREISEEEMCREAGDTLGFK